MLTDTAESNDAAPVATTHRDDIQGLRGVAVALVVLFHAGAIVQGGFIGVDVFFVISGFVITRLLWREIGETQSISLRRFYTRRIRRLLPALALVLAFVAVGGFVFQSTVSNVPTQTAKDGWAATLFSANWVLYVQSSGGYFARASTYLPLLHTWTLAVEEQFYLFFPLLLLVVTKLVRHRSPEVRRRFLIGTIVAVVVVSFVLGVYLSVSSAGPVGNLARNRSLAFFASPTRAWEFAAGSLCALFELRLTRLGRSVAVGLGLVGVALVLLASFVFTGATPFPGTAALLPVTGTMLVIAAGTTTSAGVTWLLRLAPVRWIGDVSYGWYLWHWPFIVYTKLMWPQAGRWPLLLAGLVSLVPTVLSYHLVENPIRFNRSLTGRRVLRVAVPCMVIPALLFGLLFVNNQHPSALVKGIQSQMVHHLDWKDGCVDNLPDSERTHDWCNWNAESTKGTILLIGDSNAGQFSEGVVAAARDADYHVVLATASGCPFVDVPRVGKTMDRVCLPFVRAWTDYVEHHRLALVVMASKSTNYIRNGTPFFADPRTGKVATSSSARLKIWGPALQRQLERITSTGSPVLLIDTVPQYDNFDPGLCPAVRIYFDLKSCAATQSRARVDADARPTLNVEAAAIAAVPGAARVSVIDDLCSPTRCSTISEGGGWIYRDDNHLSVATSMLLGRKFQGLIAKYAQPVHPVAKPPG